MLIQPTKEDMQQVNVIGGDDRNPSQSSTFDRQTLQDIADHDRANLMHVIQTECKTYHFQNPKMAQAAGGEALRLALLRFGIEIDGTVPAETLDETMKAKGVRVESRLDYRDEDSFRNGIYVYRNNEIAYFISQIRPKMVISGMEFQFFTNVDVMASPRFYTVMGGGMIIQPKTLNTLKVPGSVVGG